MDFELKTNYKLVSFFRAIWGEKSELKLTSKKAIIKITSGFFTAGWIHCNTTNSHFAQGNT